MFSKGGVVHLKGCATPGKHFLGFIIYRILGGHYDVDG